MNNNYVDMDEPWKGILAAEAFATRSTFNTTSKKLPGQPLFGRDMFVPIGC